MINDGFAGTENKARTRDGKSHSASCMGSGDSYLVREFPNHQNMFRVLREDVEVTNDITMGQNGSNKSTLETG